MSINTSLHSPARRTEVGYILHVFVKTYLSLCQLLIRYDSRV